MANPLIQQCEDKSREVEKEIQRLFDQVNRVLSHVPGVLEYLIRPIVDGMEALGKSVQEFWDRVNKVWDQPGDPDKLKEVGEQWVNHVGNALGDIADTIKLDQLRTNVEWTGRAARAYSATVPPQSEGLESIKDIAGQMRGSLTNLANAIENFWTAFWFTLAGLVVGIVIAIACACTVVGIPAAIVELAAILTASIAAVGAMIAAVEARNDTIDVEQTVIKQKIDDLGADWKMPNTKDMADASVADGDSSDWTLD